MIRADVLLSLFSIVSTPALAQPSLPQAEGAVLPRLIDSLCEDFVREHNGCEQVILLASETEPDQADLIILTDWRTDPASAPLLIARNIAYNGAMWGMAPSLERAENGSLLLRSEQSGIGRFPWFQTLTIANRDGGFVLAGFSYSSYDRARGGGMSCDVNFLTGAYMVEATRVDPESLDEVVVLEETGTLPSSRQRLDQMTGPPVLPPPCLEGLAALSAE